jgi:hypothetical protein
MEWIVAVFDERIYVTHVLRDVDGSRLLPELITPLGETASELLADWSHEDLRTGF